MSAEVNSTAARTLRLLLLCGVGIFAIARLLGASSDGTLEALATGRPEVTAEVRAAGLRFAATVPEADRAWILAAVARARPEARRLIDEVDGLVEVRTHSDQGDAVGWARSGQDGSVVSVDTAALNGDRALDRNVVVLHELGHVIDYMLVDDELVRRLDTLIPRTGTCASDTDMTGACTAVEERFADTFAKWALHGAVSLAGSGYGIPAPASIEDWGAPLGLLAAQLTVDAGRG
jgi:hypothetical protein